MLSSCLSINTQLKRCRPSFRITAGSPSVYALTNLPPLMSHPLWTFLFPCLSSLLNCDLWQIGIIFHLYDLIKVLKTCSYIVDVDKCWRKEWTIPESWKLSKPWLRHSTLSLPIMAFYLKLLHSQEMDSLVINIFLSSQQLCLYCMG